MSKELYGSKNLLNAPRLGQAIQEISTGNRVNFSKDDSEKFSKIQHSSEKNRMLDQVRSNINNGRIISITASAAVAEVKDGLQRMRMLVLDAANGACSDDDRIAIQEKIIQLKEELSSIADSTQFGSFFLLNGSHPSFEFQIGTESDKKMTIDMMNVQPSQLGGANKIEKIDITEKIFDENLTSIDEALKALNAFSVQLEKNEEFFNNVIENLTA